MNIEEIEARAHAATEGPIAILPSGWMYSDGMGELNHLSCMARQGALHPEDALLFAQARETELGLCALVRELRAALEQSQAEKEKPLYALFLNGELHYEFGMDISEDLVIRNAENGYDEDWSDLEAKGYSCRPVTVVSAALDAQKEPTP
jgi:hypothetical protein